MPGNLQSFSPTESAWIEAGNSNWDGVIKIAEENQVVGVDATELAFLAGEGKFRAGKKMEALDYYTKAYSFGYGANPKVAKLCLKKSSEILGTVEREGRKAELQSQLKIYKELFGGGSLWNGAPPAFVELANADLDLSLIHI